MYSRLLNIFRFNRVFWWIICFLLISNIVFFATFRESQKNRIDELHDLYNVKRNSPTLKKDNDQESFLQAEEDINTFKGKLPERKDFTETAAELFTIFKKHQIDIGQTVYKPEQIDFQGLFQYATTLSIKGSYPSIKALLADIQESRTLFCIEALSISSNSGESSVELRIKIATYFR
jgi:hypothetical protein